MRDAGIYTRSRSITNCNRDYLLTVDQLLDAGRMPDHAYLALLPLRQALLAVGALLGHVLVVILHDDAEDDVAPFVHAIDDILVEVLILRRDVRRGSHLSCLAFDETSLTPKPSSRSLGETGPGPDGWWTSPPSPLLLCFYYPLLPEVAEHTRHDRVERCRAPPGRADNVDSRLDGGFKYTVKIAHRGSPLRRDPRVFDYFVESIDDWL